MIFVVQKQNYDELYPFITTPILRIIVKSAVFVVMLHHPVIYNM